MTALALRTQGIKRTAEFSPCGQYRYSLTRVWDETAPRACWIGVNPSTADADRDDPTICREMAFSRSWGFGSLEKVNLFPFITSDPRILRKSGEIACLLGNDASAPIRAAALRSGFVVCAWGDSGGVFARRRALHVLELLEWLKPQPHLKCLGLTKAGMPKHSLARGKHRVPDNAEPLDYVWQESAA